MILNIILGVVVYTVLFMIGYGMTNLKEKDSYVFKSLLPLLAVIQILLYTLLFFRSPRVFWRNMKSLKRRLHFLSKTLAILQYICILVNILLTN